MLGGNIGKAVLDLPPFADGRHYVIEFSSFQLDLTPGLDADAAILLNVTPDHIDRHGSLENYAAVKETIFKHAHAAIIGADDGFCDAIAERAIARGVRTFRISASHPVNTGVYAEGSELFEASGGAIQNRASLKGIGSLRGAHNAQNASAALAALRSLGLTWDMLAEGLKSFPGLAHRMEEVRRIGRVLFVNDSKATNADAAERALTSFSNIYWIAGGKPKEGGITSLAPYFPRIKKAYLIGDAAGAFAATLGQSVPFTLAQTLDRAVAEAAADAAAERRKKRWCCYRRPARPTINSPISRCAAPHSAHLPKPCLRGPPRTGPHEVLARGTGSCRRLVAVHRPHLADADRDACRRGLAASLIASPIGWYSSQGRSLLFREAPGRGHGLRAWRRCLPCRCSIRRR